MLSKRQLTIILLRSYIAGFVTSVVVACTMQLLLMKLIYGAVSFLPWFYLLCAVLYTILALPLGIYAIRRNTRKRQLESVKWTTSDELVIERTDYGH